MTIKKLYLILYIMTLSGASLADTVPDSTYDWTGVYVGGFVGGASGANTTSSSSNTTNYLGYIPAGSNSASSNSSTSASFIGGGTVGYNWQIPKTPYLIGFEGEYGYLGQSGSSQSQSLQDGLIGVSTNTQNKTTIGSDYGYGLVGGRIGYALDRSLFYVKSGAVFTQVKSTNSTSAQDGLGEFNAAGSSKSGGATTGYAIGGGVEFAPQWYSNENITVKVEYLYFGIPTTNDSSQTFYLQAAVPDGPMPFYTENTSYHNSTSGIHTAKIGVNYKF
jgi:outer membrane immunogenic protein